MEDAQGYVRHVCPTGFIRQAGEFWVFMVHTHNGRPDQLALGQG